MRNLLLLSLAIILFSSCATTYAPINQKLINDNGWKDEDLKKIQFYTSHDVVLYRQVTQGNTTITHGDIKIVNGKQVEQISIKRHTPGILLAVNDGRFAVAFEDGDKYYLMFGEVESHDGRYLLLASDWKNDLGEITYGDQKYFTDVSSARCLLLVNMKLIDKQKINERVAKGRKVDQ